MIVNLSLKLATGRQIKCDRKSVEFNHTELICSEIIECNVEGRQIRARVVDVSPPMLDNMPGMKRDVSAEEI
jgi:hypothetical protein